MKQYEAKDIATVVNNFQHYHANARAERFDTIATSSLRQMIRFMQAPDNGWHSLLQHLKAEVAYRDSKAEDGDE